MGDKDDDVMIEGKRREIFDIADNEQLIGCELDHNWTYYLGVTWLKIKLN